VWENASEVKELATIHFDGGGQSPGPVTAACIVELSDGSVVQAVRRFDQGTHNTAEWHALILGLHLALNHGERHVVVKGDSTLVVKQVKREWKTKNPALLPLRTEAEELLAQFENSRVEWIRRKENRRADELGRGVMSLTPPVPTGGD
jgi:ribonuclease HI